MIKIILFCLITLTGFSQENKIIVNWNSGCTRFNPEDFVLQEMKYSVLANTKIIDSISILRISKGYPPLISNNNEIARRQYKIALKYSKSIKQNIILNETTIPFNYDIVNQFLDKRIKRIEINYYLLNNEGKYFIKIYKF